MRPLLSLFFLTFLCTCACAQVTLMASVGLAEGYCKTPDPKSYRPVPQEMDYLTYLLGEDEDVVVTYRIHNSSAEAKIVQLSLVDKEFGEVIPLSLVDIGPGETHVVTRRYSGFTKTSLLSIGVRAKLKFDGGKESIEKATYHIEVVPAAVFNPDRYSATDEETEANFPANNGKVFRGDFDNDPLGDFNSRRSAGAGIKSRSNDPVGTIAIRAYPNPASDRLYLEGYAGGTALVLDQYGRLLREVRLGVGQPLEVSDLVPGMYLLRLTTPNGLKTVKWMKQ